LEFSFDRSKESSPNNTSAQTGSTGVKAGPDLNSVDPSTIANERLRKAIERNRAKQAARDSGVQAQTQTPASEATANSVPHEQPSFFSKSQAENVEIRSTPPLHDSQQDNHNIHYNQELRSSQVVSRRTVARPEEAEFVPAKRPARKLASQVSYATGASKRKSREVDTKYLGYLVKGCWIFCGIMVLRLLFANGGVTDFYSQKKTMNEKLDELSNIKKENMQLVREIERMKFDVSFQRKLVRDNLGFIASDEFLILFPKD
jgi:hypothetical protein